MLKRIYAVLGLAVLLILLTGAPVSAKARVVSPGAVNVLIDISSQSMLVKVNGWHYSRWKVSTARTGYYTPRGAYRVQRTAKVYFSKKYDNAPMPHSVFFHGGYAIHGTFYVKNLGRPASHGCIRLAPQNAAAFYNLVQKYGASSTRITIVN